MPPGLEDSLPTNLNDTFETVRAGAKKSAETYVGLCNLLERLSKRNQGVAADYSRFANTLKSLTEESDSTYATDTNDVPLLNEGIKSTAKHLETSRSLLEDEAHAWDEGVLEDFKRQRDSLIGVRDMFERRDRYARDNIPQLERRIESNESKLMAVRAKPENLVKPGEIEKLEQAIMNVSLVPVATLLHSYLVPRAHATAGQAINRGPARSRCLHQRMHPRRTTLLSAIAVPRQQIASGLEPGTHQICGIASG